MTPLAPHSLRELHIIAERSGEKNALDFFDHTQTQGGRDALKNLIKSPKSDLSELLSFQHILKFIIAEPERWKLDIPRSYVSAAEGYYNSSISYSMSQDVFQHWFDTMIFSFRHPAEFDRVRSGLSAAVRLLQEFQKFTARFQESKLPSGLLADFEILRKFFKKTSLKSFSTTKPHKLSKNKILYLDYYLRVSQRKTFRKILDIFYLFDAYISIVKTAQLHRLCFPEFVEGKVEYSAAGLWQPFIENPVANDFHSDQRQPLCLLTGANTSGKTTFLKTCGLAIYLAHLGWPVPANSLRLSFFDHLFTSIHLSDDLHLGYSHFYNEVIRIKEIAKALCAGKSCLVIIDELFRGTNTEDALHCSRQVLNGFISRKSSLFLVSTHLLEVVNEFSTSPSISLNCFKTIVKSNDFENTFKIERGIASEKIGRMILEKTGVSALLTAKNEDVSKPI